MVMVMCCLYLLAFFSFEALLFCGVAHNLWYVYVYTMRSHTSGSVCSTIYVCLPRDPRDVHWVFPRANCNNSPRTQNMCSTKNCSRMFLCSFRPPFFFSFFLFLFPHLTQSVHSLQKWVRGSLQLSVLVFYLPVIWDMGLSYKQSSLLSGPHIN